MNLVHIFSGKGMGYSVLLPENFSAAAAVMYFFPNRGKNILRKGRHGYEQGKTGDKTQKADSHCLGKAALQGKNDIKGKMQQNDIRI